MRERQNIPVIPPSDPNVSSYVDIIAKSKGNLSSQKTYLPIIQISIGERQRDRLLEPLYSKSERFGGLNAFSYFVGEIVDNIYQHSISSTAYIMAQEYQTKRFIDVGVIDNGVSIPGAFEKAKISFNVDVEDLKKSAKWSIHEG